MAKKYHCITAFGGLSTMNVELRPVRYDFSPTGGLRGVFVMVDRCCDIDIQCGDGS